ncbi:MAG: hypothetical protein J2P57_04470 [Acidimicrobiaceae bacterium]|nr:hypothetical protein [Acidimicrobiaceae bacterium]
MDNELSEAIVAYLQRGKAPSPRADAKAVRSIALSDPGELVARVTALVEESVAVPVDWSTLSLGDAGRAAAAEMARRHPELSQEALDALSWNFTFQWR